MKSLRLVEKTWNKSEWAWYAKLTWLIQMRKKERMHHPFLAFTYHVVLLDVRELLLVRIADEKVLQVSSSSQCRHGPLLIHKQVDTQDRVNGEEKKLERDGRKLVDLVLADISL